MSKKPSGPRVAMEANERTLALDLGEADHTETNIYSSDYVRY
jgi:hypothetical protein